MFSKMKILLVLFALCFAVLCIAGCEMLKPEPEETPIPTETPRPTNTPQVFEFVPVVTETPVPVTPTPTPEPTEVPITFADYAPTVNMTYEELVGSTNDMGMSAKEILKDGFPDPKTYYIIVDKYWQVVMVYMRKEGSSGHGEPDYERPVRYMLCSTGNPKTEYGHETQNGIFEIDLPRERFYQFVNLEAAQYLTCIHSRTYFHSVLYKKKGDLSTLIKDSYDNLGSKASHACVRLTVPDARWMFYNIGYGTTCEVRDGSKDDERTASIREQLKLPPSKSDVKLSAKDYTWTDNWSIDEIQHDIPFKYMRPRMPEGYDENGNKIEEHEEEPDPQIVPVEDQPAGGGEETGGNNDGGNTGGGDIPIIE